MKLPKEIKLHILSFILSKCYLCDKRINYLNIQKCRECNISSCNFHIFEKHCEYCLIKKINKISCLIS